MFRPARPTFIRSASHALVSQDTQPSQEFRRYRQVLVVVYLTTATCGFGLLAASVLKELFFRRPAVELPDSAISLANPDPSHLLDCERQVLGLLTALGTKTCELLALPPSGDRSEIPARWEDFSRAWRDEWDVVDARCRFSELADSHLGVAFDRLAQVHSDLPTMRLKYQSLLVRFDDEQAAELARMRRALDQSREAFREQAEERGTLAPATRGPGTEPTPPDAP